MDDYDLEDYYRWSIEPNSYSIVYKVEGRVWGVMNLEMREDYVYIAMLGRNVVAVGPVGSLLCESLRILRGNWESRRCGSILLIRP